MRRHKNSKRESKAKFRTAAAKTIKKQLSAKPRRGGIRM